MLIMIGICVISSWLMICLYTDDDDNDNDDDDDDDASLNYHLRYHY